MKRALTSRRARSALFLMVASAAASLSLAVSDASAQSTACPPARVRGPIPVELGLAAAEREDWTQAAIYFEQNKNCIELNRPNVRDGTNALAAFRALNAYLSARDMANTLRIADEALAWHPGYVAGLAPGADKSDQFNMLIFFYGARALALMDARPAQAEASLNQARSLLMSNPSERPESALMVLAMLGTLIEDDYNRYVPVQRDLVQRLRQFGPEYRAQLRQELLNYARVSRAHGDSAAATTMESEARGLR